MSHESQLKIHKHEASIYPVVCLLLFYELWTTNIKINKWTPLNITNKIGHMWGLVTHLTLIHPQPSPLNSQRLSNPTSTYLQISTTQKTPFFKPIISGLQLNTQLCHNLFMWRIVNGKTVDLYRLITLVSRYLPQFVYVTNCKR